MSTVTSAEEEIKIPESLLRDLPSDPFEQLEIARRIAENAWKSRVAMLEKEVEVLKVGSDVDTFKLQQRILELERILSDTNRKFSRALDEQAQLGEERDSLVNTVKKLNREIVKLEAFKNTLLDQLEENQEEEHDHGQVSDGSAKSRSNSIELKKALAERAERNIQDQYHFQGKESSRDNRPPMKSFRRPSSEQMDIGLEGRLAGARILRSRPGQRSTALTTPSLSPFFMPSQSATPRENTSPRRQSGVGVQFDYGKDFFKEAKKRLTLDEFKLFLENIKDLAARKKSRKEAIKCAGDLLANDQDLFAQFVGVLEQRK